MRIITNQATTASLSARGLRTTQARRLILEAVRATDAHPTAEWVFRQVRRRLPHVSLGTVYRNLRQLVKCGLLVERTDPGGSRFDGNTSEHHHFTCLRCGRVFDLAEPVDRALQRQVASRTGFEVIRHRIEFFGRCGDCSASRRGRRVTWRERV
jgi:Fe2+ or Zn2+ uptake regulation protein